MTWIHNVFEMDAIMCIDDIESKKGLQLLTEEAGWKVLADRSQRLGHHGAHALI